MNVIDTLTAATKSYNPADDESAVKLRKALQSAQQALQAAEADDERKAAEERCKGASRAYDARVAELDELRKQAVAAAKKLYGAAFMNAKQNPQFAVPQRARGVVRELPTLALGETQVVCAGVQHVDACPCEVCQRRARGSTMADDDGALEAATSARAGRVLRGKRRHRSAGKMTSGGPRTSRRTTPRASRHRLSRWTKQSPRFGGGVCRTTREGHQGD
jgi:hypothetical protein